MPVIPDTLPEISRLIAKSKLALQHPLSNTTSPFDTFALSGFFGGDCSVRAMASINLMLGRRWVGWYNNSGGIEVAKKYARLSHWRVFDALFDGERDPARLFKLDGRQGPPFITAHSGINSPFTGHFGHLIANKVADMESNATFEGTNRSVTTSPSITIVNMQHVPELQCGQDSEYHPALPQTQHFRLSLLPIAMSICACLGCALTEDWFCFASIAVGIAAHGFACSVIGSGKLIFKMPKPPSMDLPGDGVLKGEREWVILVGAESVVSAFTQGRFLLQYGAKKLDTPQGLTQYRPGYDRTRNGVHGRTDVSRHAGGIQRRNSRRDHHPRNMEANVEESIQATSSSSSSTSDKLTPTQSFIGVCAALLIAQAPIQLLLIPRGTFYGQLLFIGTVVVSWIHNMSLSSIDRDELQLQILFKELQLRKEHMHKYELNTTTASIAFACFTFASANPFNDPLAFLDAILPSNVAVWKAWKVKMSEKLRAGVETGLTFTAEDLQGVEEESHRELLRTFFDDAENAWLAWNKVRDHVFPHPAAHSEL